MKCKILIYDIAFTVVLFHMSIYLLSVYIYLYIKPIIYLCTGTSMHQHIIYL